VHLVSGDDAEEEVFGISVPISVEFTEGASLEAVTGLSLGDFNITSARTSGGASVNLAVMDPFGELSETRSAFNVVIELLDASDACGDYVDAELRIVPGSAADAAGNPALGSAPLAFRWIPGEMLLPECGPDVEADSFQLATDVTCEGLGPNYSYVSEIVTVSGLGDGVKVPSQVSWAESADAIAPGWIEPMLLLYYPDPTDPTREGIWQLAGDALVDNGDQLRVGAFCMYAFAPAYVNVTLGLGSVSSTWRLSSPPLPPPAPPDVTLDLMDLGPDVSGVQLGTWVRSAVQTVGGLGQGLSISLESFDASAENGVPTAVRISKVGEEEEEEASLWNSTVIVQNGDAVRLAVLSAAVFETPVIGGVRYGSSSMTLDTLSVTTAAACPGGGSGYRNYTTGECFPTAVCTPGVEYETTPATDAADRVCETCAVAPCAEARAELVGECAALSGPSCLPCEPLPPNNTVRFVAESGCETCATGANAVFLHPNGCETVCAPHAWENVAGSGVCDDPDHTPAAFDLGGPVEQLPQVADYILSDPVSVSHLGDGILAAVYYSRDNTTETELQEESNLSKYSTAMDAWTTVVGATSLARNGDVFRLRVEVPSTWDTARTYTVSIGTVSDTFTVRTPTSPDSAGGWCSAPCAIEVDNVTLAGTCSDAPACGTNAVMAAVGVELGGSAGCLTGSGACESCCATVPSVLNSPRTGDSIVVRATLMAAPDVSSSGAVFGAMRDVLVAHAGITNPRVLVEWPDGDGDGACPVGTCIQVAAHFAAAGWAPNSTTGGGAADYDYEYGDYALARTPANNTFLAAKFADAMASGAAAAWFPEGVLDTRMDAVTTDYADFQAVHALDGGMSAGEGTDVGQAGAGRGITSVVFMSIGCVALIAVAAAKRRRAGAKTARKYRDTELTSSAFADDGVENSVPTLNPLLWSLQSGDAESVRKYLKTP